MNRYAAALVLFGLAILQTTVMPAASLETTRPFLPLLAVVTWGLQNGAMAGGWWALAAGLMLDVLTPAPIGSYALPLIAAAAVVALAGGRLFPSNLLIPAAVVLAATVSFHVVQRTLIALGGDCVYWQPAVLAEELLPALALNLLWLPVVYFPLRAVARTSQVRMDWER